jgi:(4S)-4-hydroxy-5-phosphonooxypentane-2,3-dione isomerase
MYAVCVTFRVHPGQMVDFMPAMRGNAATSLAEEVGCHRFDVLSDTAKPDLVFLYELYTDRAAFDAHCASPHFQAFNAATAEMVADKDVATWDRVAP